MTMCALNEVKGMCGLNEKENSIIKFDLFKYRYSN